MTPNADQLKELSERINQDPNILTGDSFFSISGDDRRRLGLDMCGACKMTCCINPFGYVYPCAFLQEDEFCAGSLTQTSFEEIWNTSTIFNFFRQLEPLSCKECSRFSTCRGGCPAMAYFIRKDLNSSDPECLINWSRNISTTLLS